VSTQSRMSIDPKVLTSAAERIRTERVARRLFAGRRGISTRNFHRDQQLQHRAFVALLCLSALGGLAVLIG
jgi:hypothetical protein